MVEIRSIGISSPRVEGEQKVGGGALYAVDVSVPDLLWAKVLRSPIAHGRIKKIDHAKASALSGVHAVLTGADLAGAKIGKKIVDMPILAEQVVRNRFQGFLLARDAADACAKAVRTVIRGELWVPRALLVQLLFEHLQAAGNGSAETPAEDNLTPREVEIINYVRRGFANKQIGEALAIREDTVKKHLRNAYTKLGVHRRTQIITSAAERFITG